MPASRKRPSGKNCSRDKLHHRRRTSTAAAASRAWQDAPTADANRSTEQMTVSVPAGELQDFLDSHLTDRDHELALLSLRAAANGDAARALDLHRQGLHVEGAAAEHELLDVLLLGDEAPDWVLCRWIARQAYRWLLLTEDARTDAAVRQTLAATYELPASLTPGLLRRLGTAVAGCDWICRELATYDFGGLTDYLHTEVSAALH